MKSLPNRLRFWRKKYVWIIVVAGAMLLKRVVDIVLSVFGLVILSPLFLLVAILIKATDGGPVLFWQTRVRQWGREFPFPKFRSMVVNAEQLQAALFSQSEDKNGVKLKMKNDPRVTWIGRIIRRLSIDELPQLWSVLKGDMSLVGPRPHILSEVAKYSLADRRRLDAIPGLTCISQVRGRRDLSFEQQVKLDVQYIESQSFWLDIKLLLKTIPAVLTGKGAY
jgi:lipopolysaccharide/colanic/teichoic acid biosynthesis glycosyltransferase